MVFFSICLFTEGDSSPGSSLPLRRFRADPFVADLNGVFLEKLLGGDSLPFRTKGASSCSSSSSLAAFRLRLDTGFSFVLDLRAGGSGSSSTSLEAAEEPDARSFAPLLCTGRVRGFGCFRTLLASSPPAFPSSVSAFSTSSSSEAAPFLGLPRLLPVGATSFRVSPCLNRNPQATNLSLWVHLSTSSHRLGCRPIACHQLTIQSLLSQEQRRDTLCYNRSHKVRYNKRSGMITYSLRVSSVGVPDAMRCIKPRNDDETFVVSSSSSSTCLSFRTRYSIRTLCISSRLFDERRPRIVR